MMMEMGLLLSFCALVYKSKREKASQKVKQVLGGLGKAETVLLSCPPKSEAVWDGFGHGLFVCRENHVLAYHITMRRATTCISEGSSTWVKLQLLDALKYIHFT